MSEARRRLLNNYSVEIPPTDDAYNYKYILIKEIMPDLSSRWSIICKNLPFHKEIAESLFKKGRTFKIHGGGRLRLNPFFDPPQLTAHDESVDYGVATPKIVGAVLSDWADKNEVEFENKMVKRAFL